MKADIRAGSSVSNAESVTALDSEGEGSTRGVNALALAGPVPNPLGYRYSADYTEPSFPPKNNVSTVVAMSGDDGGGGGGNVEKSRRIKIFSVLSRDLARGRCQEAEPELNLVYCTRKHRAPRVHIKA